MAIIRWEPLRELNSLQSEVNRLFNAAFEGPVSAQASAAAPRRWIPAMDLVESGDHFLVRADLPGLSEEDVAIEAEDGTLTISGERSTAQESQNGVTRFERAFGTFSRSPTLPKGTDPAGITASFDRGVLELRIPKPEEHKPRRITIDVTGREASAPAIEGAEAPAPAVADAQPAAA